MKLFFAFIFLLCSLGASAEDVVRIEISKNFDSYTNADLRRRVWTLEQAVYQLQRRVFELEMGKVEAPKNLWTCRLQSFGKTIIESNVQKSVALALVLKKCSDATSSVHCSESDVNCSND